MNLIFSIACIFAVWSGLLSAQTAMTSTTLSAAAASSDQTVTVASATGIIAADLKPNTYLFIDKEAMRVKTVSGTLIGVERGAEGTRITDHASGARVWLGPPESFYTGEPAGSCTASAERYHPRVVITTGNVFSCMDGEYRKFEGSSTLFGTPNTGVTAFEYGDTRRRFTKLTFTNLAIGNSGGAANLALGKLLYTLPAGAIIVKSAHMSVALTGAGATIDADTPDGGLGTTIGSGANALLSATAAFENILTGQTFDNLTATVETKTVGDQVLVIESGSNHTVYFNLADGWAGAADITATGTVVIEWVLLN